MRMSLVPINSNVITVEKVAVKMQLQVTWRDPDLLFLQSFVDGIKIYLHAICLKFL